MGADAQFLRRHVLELPIHQDLTPRHIDHMARQVPMLSLEGSRDGSRRLQAVRWTACELDVGSD